MIKLIVSDLDGTLLDEPNSISRKNLDAIGYAYQKGVKLCLATGRDLASVNSIKKLLPQEPLLLLGNGAQFFNEHGQLIDKEYFPNEYLGDVIDVLKRYQIDHMVFTTDGIYTTGNPGIVRKHFLERIEAIRSSKVAEIFRTSAEKPCNNLQEIKDYKEFIIRKKIIKVEGFHICAEPIEMAKEEYRGYQALSCLSTGINNVEVTGIHAQKGLILARNLDRLKLKRDEVMVMGDSYNDISLFEQFPYSFAPGNSCEEIKEKAYRIVCSCNEHAVREAIFHMI